MVLKKKEIILKLQAFGLKARYSNICFFYNSKFEVVGGCLFLNDYCKVYFKVENDAVLIVEGYDDLYDLIFGIKEGD